MNNGWIKLHRKITEWEWYSCPNVVRLFTHCILKANHKKKNWRGNVIPRGTFITSYNSLSEETGLSTRQLRTAFNKLESTGEVDKRSTSINSWVTVVNYDEYQRTDKVATKERQAVDKGATTTKNDNNVKNDKKNHYGDDFEDFWELYDLKKGKKKAWLEWKKQSDEDIESIFENIPIFLTHFSSKQYTPRPRKYLYNRYWEDEGYQQPKKKSSKNGQQKENRAERFFRIGEELFTGDAGNDS